MGTQQSSPSNHKQAPFITISEMNNQIDKFCTSEINRYQFLNNLFPIIENKKHPLGKMKICNSYILERLYLVLKNKNDCVSCSELKTRFYKMLTTPQKAIELSFQLIDLDNDKYITNAEFLNYIDNSFINLMFTVENSITDPNFKIQLKQWVQTNKKKLLEKIMEVFKKNLKSHPQRWNYGDFKNWIVSGQNWTLQIEIGPQKYRTPLNLLCMFGMR